MGLLYRCDALNLIRVEWLWFVWLILFGSREARDEASEEAARMCFLYIYSSAVRPFWAHRNASSCERIISAVFNAVCPFWAHRT